MKNHLADEQFDALMRSLVKEAGADETLLSEIADSPATWWGVQRKINEQKAEKLSAWPPLGKPLRWLLAGGAVTTAAVLILTFFIFRPDSHGDNGVVAEVPTTNTTIENREEPVRLQGERIGEPIGVEPRASKVLTPVKQVVNHIAVKSHAEKRTKNAVKTEIAAKSKNKEEIKTEFIALSYARDPESGHVIRVKVPSAMMVSLGLVTSVKTPTDLVDAEVLLGDDGLTRAIRFIR